MSERRQNITIFIVVLLIGFGANIADYMDLNLPVEEEAICPPALTEEETPE